MDEKRARAIVKHAVKQAEAQKRLRAMAFDKQVSVLDDPSRLKSVLCSRRAGKSFLCGIGLFEAALSQPYVNCMYIGLIRDTARNIMWDPILKRISRELTLGLTKKDFNETTLTVKLRNGSTIRLVGLDKDSDQLDKVLGTSQKRIIIDEAASFRTDLKTLVFQHLKPSTTDTLGDIWMTGTPGQVRSFFYDVTTAPVVEGLTRRPKKNEEDGGEVNGWSPHTWGTLDNPHMKVQWEQELADILKNRPEFIDTPAFRHMYKGEWYTDETDLCYHYLPERNGIRIQDLPEMQDGVISCDLGFEDATAFMVAGWNEHDPHLYVVHAEKKTKMDISDVVEKFKELQARFPWARRLVVDGANKQAVEEMRRRHGLALIATEKRGKADFMFQMDTDLRTGVIRVVDYVCEDLLVEWSELVWDKKAEAKGKKQEHPNCANHLSDSALYGWRYSRNFWHSDAPKVAAIRVTQSEEELNQWAKEEMNRIRRRRKKEDWDDKDWSPD